MQVLSADEQVDLTQVLDWLKSILGSRLVSVVLFGSRARRDHRPGSDYDVLVIANGLPDDFVERDRFFYERRRGRGLPRLGLVAKSPQLFESYLASLYLDIAIDGIILYDPRGYAATKLARIRELIKEAGLFREAVPDAGFLWDWEELPPPGRWSLEWDGFIRDVSKHAS